MKQITIKDPKTAIIIRTESIWYYMDFDALLRNQWRGGLFVEALRLVTK